MPASGKLKTWNPVWYHSICFLNHIKPPVFRARNLTCAHQGNSSVLQMSQLKNILPGASTQDPTHDKVMRRRPDKQGGSGLQGFRKAAPVLTLKMISVFLMLAVLGYSLISVSQVEGLPWSLSKQNQPRTLINMSLKWWYPIRLSRMKAVFQFRPLCWHSALLGKCMLMHVTAHNTLIINSIKNLITQKALTGTEPARRWGSPIREHKILF